MISLLKTVGGPGSLGFLAVCLAAALAVGRIGPRARRLSRVWIALLLGIYLVLALPWIANSLTQRLTSYQPLGDLEPVRQAETLIVLDGDNVFGRMRETMRLYEAARPARVIVSGREWLLESLIAMGLDRARVQLDEQSSNTREQIAYLATLVRPDEPAPVLIASRLHMPRVAALVRAAGMPAMLAPSPLDADPADSGPWLFVPSYAALRASREALYEHAALPYYRRHGWIQ